VAAGGISGRDFETRAQHCLDARHLLCRGHGFELEIRLHHPNSFFDPDYSVSGCGGVALIEDRLNREQVPGVCNDTVEKAMWLRRTQSRGVGLTAARTPSGSRNRTGLD